MVVGPPGWFIEVVLVVLGWFWGLWGGSGCTSLVHGGFGPVLMVLGQLWRGSGAVLVVLGRFTGALGWFWVHQDAFGVGIGGCGGGSGGTGSVGGALGEFMGAVLAAPGWFGGS